MTLAETMAAVTIGAVSMGIALPSLATMHRSWKLTGAARDMAVTMHRARMEAVARGAYVGIHYERAPAGDRYRLYLDGGLRGIRASEIASGTDTPLGEPVDLTASYSGVRFGIAARSTVACIPPASGNLSPADDPIAFGGSDIFSAAPTGETSTGTLYLTDGDGMRAVVVYGPTGRIRLWKWDGSAGQWRL